MITKSEEQAIIQAIRMVKTGTVKRVDVSDSIKVYKAGTVTRVDVKDD